MQTNLIAEFRDSPEGHEAEAILRTCVHCGFCLATCPTYQLLGDELDSPRGRIYLMKQVFEGHEPTEKTQLHLDRCLTCRACETTCPSGVKYGRLVDIGRGIVEKRVGRSTIASAKRAAVRKGLLSPKLFSTALKLGQASRALLPPKLRDKIPAAQSATPWPAPRHRRQMLILQGCVQPSLAPNINGAAARVLDKLGISLIVESGAGCCGAVSYHMNVQEEGLDYMRRNVTAWIHHLDAGVEGIVVTASGCGTTLKEYGHMLAHDLSLSGLAQRVSEQVRDISEVIIKERDKLAQLLAKVNPLGARKKIAFHPPCSLQHAQKLKGVVEPLLTLMGYELTAIPNAHLCCGSAGTYSIFQPELAAQLGKNKVEALESGQPDLIATANIGCMTHIQGGTALEVKHWIELLDERLQGLA